jgi:hypothetical protein
MRREVLKDRRARCSMSDLLTSDFHIMQIFYLYRSDMKL